jgi:microcin C transport system permease protein
MMRLSKLNQERWQRFKANKRGFISLWIFLFFFVLSLFSEVIANDIPLLVRNGGRLYLPLLKEYAETEFGGEFETAADYRDPYVIDLIEEDGWILWPPIRFSFDTINYDLPSPAPSPPSRGNLLGTDDRGRDVLARVIYGFRVSVLFGFILTFFSTIIGVSVGAVQGFYGGWIDLLGQRFMEIWSGIPTLYILIILSSVVQPNFWLLLAILLLFSWMSYGHEQCPGHVQAYSAQRDDRYIDLPALYLERLDSGADFPGFPGIRITRWFSISGRAVGSGQDESTGAVVGHHHLPRVGRHVDLAGVRW